MTSSTCGNPRRAGRSLLLVTRLGSSLAGVLRLHFSSRKIS
uniref:Uncharacterized protein n=1 Tax=Zea mays TaxID=4577 RepID=B4FN84_MAIZE|nr:unknown [Zea mays]